MKFRVSGQQFMHVRTSLHTLNQAYVCRQDYAYVSPCPKNLKTKKQSGNKIKTQKESIKEKEIKRKG